MHLIGITGDLRILIFIAPFHSEDAYQDEFYQVYMRFGYVYIPSITFASASKELTN